MKKHQINTFIYKNNKNRQKNILNNYKIKKNEIIKTNSEILKECRLFYQKLFTKQENCVETQNEISKNLPNSMKN